MVQRNIHVHFIVCMEHTYFSNDGELFNLLFLIHDLVFICMIFTFLLSVYVCDVCGMVVVVCVYMLLHVCKHVKVRGKLVRFSSLIPLLGFWGWNSYCWAW